METLHVQFEDGSYLKMEPQNIRKLCFDLRSWFGVIRMIAGYSEFAVLVITSKDHQNRYFAEGRAAVFMNEPPYNWEFPETA